MASIKTWTIVFKRKAEKQFRKLDHQNQKLIQKFLREKLQKEQDPRRFGTALKGDLGEFWRYRVGDYRLICSIDDHIVTIEILKIAHRRDVYKH